MQFESIKYVTNISANVCFDRLINPPYIYRGADGSELWYSVEKIYNNQILIMFKGGQFRKIMRTQYWIEFVSSNGHTEVILRFYKEMLGLPALTPRTDVDQLMTQKLSASRMS